MKRAALLGKQFGDGEDRGRCVQVRWVAVVNGPVGVEHAGIVGASAICIRSGFQGFACLLGLLPWGRGGLLRC